MKLYYAPGACSLSPHIVLREGGFDFTLEKVDLGTKKTETGRDYREINPKGYVPALELDDGSILTEGPAIVQYLADRVPERGLAPANGTMERYRLQEWLNYISTELHKTWSPLFRPDAPDAWKQACRETLRHRYGIVERALADGRPYLMGEAFTVADAYLFTVTNWARFVDFDLSPFPALRTYQERVAARPAVQEALRAEGLLR